MASVQTGDVTGGSVPASSTSTDVKPDLSQREQEVLMAAWLCIKGAEPQVDYDKLASILGLKNGRSASTTFYLVRKKIQSFRGQAGDVGESRPSPLSKGSVTPRKRTAKDPTTPKPKKAAKGIKYEESLADERNKEDVDEGI